MNARLIPTLMLIAMLAGCADEPPAPEPVAEVDVGPGTAVALTADDAARAPSWDVGDWFGHHIYFGAQDTEGSHINTVVVEAGGNYLMLPDDPEVAKWEAAWDFPMLGSIGKSDLGTTAFGSDWRIYKFPMRNGDTWTATVDPLFSGPRELTMTATFNPAISTPYGVFPGFDIIGVNATGGVELVTDFVPEIGWYSQLKYLDTTTADPEDFVFNIRSMGRGAGWNGTVHTAVARSVIQQQVLSSPDDPASYASALEHATFTVKAEAEELYGIIFALSASGRTAIDLVDPAQEHYQYEVTEADTVADNADAIFEFVELAAVPGDWQYFRSQPGLVGFTLVWLWEITFDSYEFAG